MHKVYLYPGIFHIASCGDVAHCFKGTDGKWRKIPAYVGHVDLRDYNVMEKNTTVIKNIRPLTFRNFSIRTKFKIWIRAVPNEPTIKTCGVIFFILFMKGVFSETYLLLNKSKRPPHCWMWKLLIFSGYFYGFLSDLLLFFFRPFSLVSIRCENILFRFSSERFLFENTKYYIEFSN